MPNTTSISVTILITKGLGPIVSHYKKNIATSNFGRLIDEVKSVYGDYLKSGSLDDLRFLLALCIRAHHGHRMPWNTTRLAVDTLIRNNIINRLGFFATFEDLYNEIKKVFTGIKFAQGPLTVYDTAILLGQLVEPTLEPTDLVYLNAGAYKGAEILLGKGKVKSVMPISVFTGLFPGLTSMEIEDVLCIYKGLFLKVKGGKSVTSQDLDDINLCCKYIPHSKEEYLRKMAYAVQP